MLVDYKNNDYRGFVFVVHENHGMMLLHCTRKRKKGPHFQLPGGHVDEHEFVSAAQGGGNAKTQLMEAARAGAARELFEETGMDVRASLERLQPAPLRREGAQSDKELDCELKKRLYFFLSVTDDDFWIKDKHDASSILRLKLVPPMNQHGSQLMLKLSVEHSGFVFEKDPNKSATLLEKHSGGHGSRALRMAMNLGSGSAKKQAMQSSSKMSAPRNLERDSKEGRHVAARQATEERGNRSLPFSESTDLLPKPHSRSWFSCFKWC